MGTDTQAHDLVCNKQWLNIDSRCIVTPLMFIMFLDCASGIGGAPYFNHKIMAQKPYFHIFDFFILCQKIV